MSSIYACDIGSTRTRKGQEPAFGWARVVSSDPLQVVGSHFIDRLVEYIARDLEAGQSVAFGIEAPLFIPIPSKADDLSRSRVGEGARSFAAPAGLTVAALGLHQTAWILGALHKRCHGRVLFTLKWQTWPGPHPVPVLLCWEAFVSGKAHAESGKQDAATAAVEFSQRQSDLSSANAVRTERPLSFVGAAALWAGWADETTILHQPCLVIKPSSPYIGDIGDAY